MVAVSVVAVMSDPGSGLAGFVRSVDVQTVPAVAFEVVVADAASDGSAGRLQQLAERRPNVTVLHADAEVAAADRLALALTRATGDFVLVVAQDQRLAPRALELLLDRAKRTAADLVLARVVTDTASGCAVLPEDADRVDASRLDPTGCLMLVRRPLLGAGAQAGALLADPPALLSRAGTVSAVGRYACASAGKGVRSATADVVLAPPTYRWDEGMLHLAVGVRLLEPASCPVRAWLVVARGLAEVAIPATVEWDERNGGTGTGSAALDSTTAEGGHPLEDGSWDLLLRLVGPSGEMTVPLGPGPTSSAVVGGRAHLVNAAAGVAQLDVGVMRVSAVGPVSASDASVVESEHGALVTLAYPALHVHGDAVLDGRLMLGTFGLPARLLCRDGHARLEAYVGALPGTSDVAVAVGGGTPLPTGLRLRIGSAGAMVLEELPVAEPAGQPSTAAGGAPLVQRLRRRLPDAVDPLVGRLARVPALRGIYRRLINR